MKYGITDVAAVLGVTTSALRYFEKEDIIKIKKDGSGRRYYDEEDAFRLISYMKYRSMDFSVKDIAYQFSGLENDWKKILEREKEARDHALEQAQYYTRLAESIDGHIHGIELIDKLLGRYEFAQSPAILFAQDRRDGWLSVDGGVQQVLNQWVSHMPQVKLGLVHSCTAPSGQGREAALPPEPGQAGASGASAFGFMIRKDSELGQALPKEGLVAIELPAFSALHTVVKAREDFAYDPHSCFSEGVRYAGSRGLITDGYAWGRILAVEVEKGERLHTYVELWIPVA